MSELPPAYLRDASVIRETADKLAEAGRSSERMIPAGRDLATRLRTFLARWQNQPSVTSQEAVLTNFRNLLLRTERHIEALHIATLAELLEFFKCRIHAHNALASIHELADLIERGTPDVLMEIQRRFKESNDEDFDPASAIAEQTAEVASQDADCARLVDEYERDWPDRLDDPHYLAILNLKLEQHESLAEELHLMKSALG